MNQRIGQRQPPEPQCASRSTPTVSSSSAPRSRSWLLFLIGNVTRFDIPIPADLIGVDLSQQLGLHIRCITRAPVHFNPGTIQSLKQLCLWKSGYLSVIFSGNWYDKKPNFRKNSKKLLFFWKRPLGLITLAFPDLFQNVYVWVLVVAIVARRVNKLPAIPGMNAVSD
ncbi:hypothetical protein [Aeromonas salmonicida]